MVPSLAGAATTTLIGTGGLDPWASQGSVQAQVPLPDGGGISVSLAVAGTQSDTVGNWNISGQGASSVSVGVSDGSEPVPVVVPTTLVSWAAETEVTTGSVKFNVATGGTDLGVLAQVPVNMVWSASLGVSGVTYDANTKYDVSFDLAVAAGFLSNLAAVGEGISFRAVDGSGNTVGGLASGDFIDLAGLLGGNPSGTYTTSFTTGSTAPTGDIELQFVAAKGLSAELLGASTEYVEISGLSMDATLVPEPRAAALLGLGAFALIFRRRV
ncbi:PEP-CTERM sorting domain-containing protein [Verrucomicrobiaceae bacterium R5-34]|nr:PEP-CTERM sorting domain-containing protein [Verrucomicrobiaceae bacterium R5-34]